MDKGEIQNCNTCGASLDPLSTDTLCHVCGNKTPESNDEGHSAIDPDIQKHAPWITAALPDYKILNVLGKGGMGIVFLARQNSLQRLVAIKVLALKLATSEKFIERFKQEAKAMGRLSHSNIIQIFDYGETGEHCYFIMEYLEGTSLLQKIRPDENKQIYLAQTEAVRITQEICKALIFAHDRGVIHRDIKPANILVGRDGSIKIADFGIAKLISDETFDAGLTQTEESFGTLKYASPEQIRSTAKVDGRADVYSLGIILFEMLKGYHPKSDNTHRLKPHTVAPRILSIAQKAYADDRDHRHKNVSELKKALDQITVRQRRKPFLFLGAACLITLILASLWIAVERQQKRDALSQLIQPPPPHDSPIQAAPTIAPTEAKIIAKTNLTNRAITNIAASTDNDAPPIPKNDEVDKVRLSIERATKFINQREWQAASVILQQITPKKPELIAQVDALRIKATNGQQRATLPPDLEMLSERELAQRPSSSMLPPAGSPESFAQARQKEAASLLGVPITVRTKKTGMIFHLVPASIDGQKPFYLAEQELSIHTQKELDASRLIKTSEPIYNSDELPAHFLTSSDARGYAEAINLLETTIARGPYRLPTDREWLRAAQTDSGDHKLPLRDAEPANGYIASNSPNGPHPVDHCLMQHPWGFYHLFGNIAEWTTRTEHPNTLLSGYHYRTPDELSATKIQSTPHKSTSLIHAGVRIARDVWW